MHNKTPLVLFLLVSLIFFLVASSGWSSVSRSGDFGLQITPADQEVQVGHNFNLEVAVVDASTSLDLSNITFRIDMTPALASIPDSTFAVPGSFIPKAFILKSVAVHGEVMSVTYSVASITLAGSTREEGLLVKLCFRADQAGEMDIDLTVLEALDSADNPLPLPGSEQVAITILEESTPTPTPTPEPSATPTPTATPTALFALELEPPPAPYSIGQVTLLPVIVSDASTSLNLSEIHFDFEVSGQGADLIYIVPEQCVAGSFIPGATLTVTDLAPNEARPVQARFILSNQNLSSTSSGSNKLMDIALMGEKVGWATMAILSASPVLDASGSPLWPPALHPLTDPVRIDWPVTGLGLEDFFGYRKKAVSTGWSDEFHGITHFDMDEWFSPERP